MLFTVLAQKFKNLLITYETNEALDGVEAVGFERFVFDIIENLNN